MYMYIWIIDGVHCNDGLFFNFLCACVLTAIVQTENCSAISLFALQIYGAAVADNLDKNRGVLNRRYFRQVRILSVFKVQVLLTATDTRVCEVQLPTFCDV